MEKKKIKYVNLECLEGEELKRFDELIQTCSKSVLAYRLLIAKRNINKVRELLQNDYFEDGSFESEEEVMELLKED